MKSIDKLISIAQDEVGYLEKSSNNNLYDKTANAGDKNYTKYWEDIIPSYQGSHGVHVLLHGALYKLLAPI